MSISNFNELNKEELKAVADQFGSTIDKVRFTKAQIIATLTEDGVTPQLYNSILAPADPDLAELDDAPLDRPAASPTEGVDEDELVLMRMTRKNHSYEVRGYRFTQQHPFVLVSEDDAEYLTSKGGGFRPATRKEIKEFYGG